ncbi:MAG: PEP-CTERM sorting domain-containing protein [Parvularculaceae bacterium]|nr:PEP-CTERM sorting domain-containing protein [Parvularculaceae bacterium]
MDKSRAVGAVLGLLGAIVAALGFAAPAQARTAVYVQPAFVPPAPLSALSTRGDNDGYLVPLNQTLALVFSQPFGKVLNGDRITIYTLAPLTGDARAIISFGLWNNGSPTIFRTQSVNAGNSLRVSNLFQHGCSLFQGCDYISITTDRARRGAEGAEIDYIDINGEVVDVVAPPAPEPAAWALMTLGFAGVAWRLKAQRAGQNSPSRAAPRSTGDEFRFPRGARAGD